MSIKLLFLYFLLGGTIVALVTYFGSQGKGLFAAFIGNMPVVTIITLCIIYLSSGTDVATSYFKGLLILLPPWILYVIGVIFFLPRLGLAPSLAIGLSLYFSGALLTIKLVH